MQFDNCWRNNKNKFMKCFWSMLAVKKIVKIVILSNMIARHTHDDIDASFGQWNIALCENDYFTILDLIKLYMDLDKDAIIPHLYRRSAKLQQVHQTLYL